LIFFIHGFCQSVLENHGHLIGYAEMPHIFEDEGDRLALIEQAIQLTPSYAASYSQQNKKDQGSFRYSALNFIADVKRKLINEDNIAPQKYAAFQHNRLNDRSFPKPTDKNRETYPQMLFDQSLQYQPIGL
jgi:hypothetical protein